MMVGLILDNLNWIFGGLGALAVGFIALMARRSGANAEKEKQVKADQKAREAVTTAKANAAKASDDELTKARNKWTKP